MVAGTVDAKGVRNVAGRGSKAANKGAYSGISDCHLLPKLTMEAKIPSKFFFREFLRLPRLSRPT